MIFIIGDSHARFNFQNLKLTHKNLWIPSITMHRIGRDQKLLNFEPYMNDENNIFIITYGEIDCRCHLYRQIEQGRNLEEICKKLVEDYFFTIKSQINKYKHIFVCSIVPPMRKCEATGQHTEFPILGTDDERVKYTKLMNSLIKELSEKNNYKFIDFYDYYSREDGTMKFELSDTICHIRDNQHIINLLLSSL
jgi:hypothetical protein